MFCPMCGSYLSDDNAKFCGVCGQMLAVPQNVPEPQSAVKNEPVADLQVLSKAAETGEGHASGEKKNSLL
ncbi:MAG: zinc ribbon domain-containing protein, partial [Clostridia bacterium]|nr:zinc ribbon domain-containing protein [Clostridia bacterium]